MLTQLPESPKLRSSWHKQYCSLCFSCFELFLTHLLVTAGLSFRTPLCPCEVDTCKVKVRMLKSVVIALAVFNVTDIVFTGMKLLVSVT